MNNLAKIVLVITAIIWFALLGYRDLIEPDEARYSEIPREMVASGDWMTPRINDFKYFEKPALQYWLTAISFEVFGESNASARLWLATGAFLCGLFVWFLGARLYGPDAGFYAFVMTLSSLLFTAMGHILTLDMSVSLFLTLGVGCLLLAQQYRDEPARNRNWMLLGWAALAAAVLTKGLIGVVLPGAAVFLYMLWQRDWAILKHLHIGKGLLLLLALTAPWFVAVSRINPEFAHFFFIHEHFERYTTTVHHRAGPLYYFIPIFVLGICPWLVSSLNSLFKPGFSWKARAGQGFNGERFIWVYIVAIFLFFSVGDSKLPAYILPIIPFVAILAGKRVQERGRVRGDQWVMAVLAAVFLGVGIFITHFASSKIPAELYAAYRPWIIVGALILAAGALALFRWAAQPRTAVAIAGICAILGYQMFLWGFQTIAVSRSSAEEAAVIQSKVPATTPVYTVETYPQALPFYLNRTVTIVGYKGELEMGIDAEPAKWLPTLQEFIQRWQNDTQAVAVMEPDAFEKLQQQAIPMTVIFKGPRRLVVVKQAVAQQ